MSRLNEGSKRILTTHTGSLPRPDALSALLFARMTKQPYAPADMLAQTAAAVAATVRKQMEVGIDIVSDGEQSKTSFQLYATERLGGLTPITPKLGERRTRENINFPTFYRNGEHSGSAQARWACTAPITYANLEPLKADLANLKAALVGVDPIDVIMAALPAGTVSGAPKVRAMEIIDELESEKRGISYAGAAGYISAEGEVDTCILLRTALFKDGVMYVQAGGGVVADSDPVAEYEETLHKSRALRRAAEEAWRFG